MIFVEDDRDVGRSIGPVAPDKLNVKKVLYKGKTYFMKDAKINSDSDRILELREKIGSSNFVRVRLLKPRLGVAGAFVAEFAVLMFQYKLTRA